MIITEMINGFGRGIANTLTRITSEAGLIIKFNNPKMFSLIIIIALLIIILYKEFVKLRLMPEEDRRRKKKRNYLLISRTIMLLLIITALAGPYTPKIKETTGNPRITLLVDQSASMSLYDTSFINDLVKNLEKKIPVKKEEFGSLEESNLGEAILENLDEGGSIIVVSDGNVNKGVSLSDVALYAANNNASISFINLKPSRIDYSVIIEGPSKIVADTEETYKVIITTNDPEDKEVTLTLSEDDKVFKTEKVKPGTIYFTRKFTKGDHRLTAEISGMTDDYFDNNNKFYKSIHSLKKPKLLLISQTINSPVEAFLKQLYEVDVKRSLGRRENLDDYYAVVLNDVPAETINPGVETLTDYLLDEKGGYYGNGLVVLGGMNSFDKGSYANSPIRALLPVKVGKGKRSTGNDNLVFILGLTGTTGATTMEKQEDGTYKEVKVKVPVEAVIRSQAINAIEQLRIDNKVGVVVYGIETIGHFKSAEEFKEKSVVTLSDIDYLYNNRKEIIEGLKEIRGGGSFNLDVALRRAVDMLRNKQGNKHIILLTDGRFCAGFGNVCKESEQVLNQVANLRKMGINVMTIGVGPENEADFPKKVDEIFLKELAKAGDGTYDRATRLKTLLIKWGDPEAKKFGEEFSLIPLSLTHFITHDLEFNTTYNGFNQVVPKDSAQLLIANDGGQPALTVWRYGNGRVAAWTVFRGGSLGGLLNQDSEALTRTINWAIGDPERKEKYLVLIDDTRTNEPLKIRIKSENPVSIEGFDFIKNGDFYEATITTDKTGFGEVMGTIYAVNRPTEYDYSGINPITETMASMTNGEVFEPTDYEKMVKHAQEVSKTVTVDKKELDWIFIIATIMLFLIEIFFRKMSSRKRGAGNSRRRPFHMPVSSRKIKW